jgi:hypothetical protein
MEHDTKTRGYLMPLWISLSNTCSAVNDLGQNELRIHLSKRSMAGHYCKQAEQKSSIYLTRKTGAIDDMHKAVSNSADENKRAEGKRIVEDLAKLKYELQHDRKLT